MIAALYARKSTERRLAGDADSHRLCGSIALCALLVFVVGCSEPAPPAQPPANPVNTAPPPAPATLSAEDSAFAAEGARLNKAMAEACVDRRTHETAIDTLSAEIKASKARRGATLDDPLNAAEAKNLADMKFLLALIEKCAQASQREVEHATEAQRRAVHDYVDDLKKGSEK